MGNKTINGVNDHKLDNFSYSRSHGVLVTAIEEKNVNLIYKADTSLNTLLEIRRSLKKPLILKELSEDAFTEQLAKTYESGTEEALSAVGSLEGDQDLQQLMMDLPKAEDLLENENDAPVIRLLNALMTEAIKLSASDIHIETFENKLTVRFRVDGVLRIVLESQKLLSPLLVSRIKVMAKLDIAEKRLPQDGRITIHLAGRAVDVRVSSIPSSHGERVVLRLLDKKGNRLRLSELGISETELEIARKMISKPHGIILVTGPTGSGKTTTLYAALTDLNNPAVNIMTVEDPIEYDLPGISQTPVNTKVDMTFAKGLRSILRQDPDIVMVGEIRDIETAKIAVQASLTGHLVLSTLHTNSAVGAITRLKDMGINPYLIASTLLGVISQRLVRLLCPYCKESYIASSDEWTGFDTDGIDNNTTIYRAVGCDECRKTGYNRRTGIYEFMLVDDTVRNMIHSEASEHEIEAYLRSMFPSMRHSGLQRVLSGETTLEEIIRVTFED